MTTKKFNARTASKEQFVKEIRRLASVKCTTGQALKNETDEAKRAELQAKYDGIVEQYDKVRAQRDKKFPGRKTYMDYTQAEIDELDLKKTVAGIASLACKRSRYPHLAAEVKKQEAKFQQHKAKLQQQAEVKAALKHLSKDELEALMAEAK